MSIASWRGVARVHAVSCQGATVVLCRCDVRATVCTRRGVVHRHRLPPTTMANELTVESLRARSSAAARRLIEDTKTTLRRQLLEDTNAAAEKGAMYSVTYVRTWDKITHDAAIELCAELTTTGFDANVSSIDRDEDNDRPLVITVAWT